MSYNLGSASGTIRITYDSSGVARAVAGVDSLEAKLKALENASTEIHVDDKLAKLKLDQIKAEIADLSAKVADPKVKIDDALAQAKIAELTTELSKLDGATENVKVKVDTKQSLTEVQQFRESMFSLIRIGLALSPAIVPVLAEITAGAAAAVGAFGAAGIGVGAFAAAAIANLGGVKQAITDLGTEQKAFNKAAAEGDAKGQLKAFTDMQATLKNLSPQERELVQNTLALKDAWQSWAATVAPQQFTIANIAIGAIRDVMKALQPVLVSVSNAMVIVAARIKEITSSDEFQSFFAGIADAAGQIVVLLSGSLLNVFHALAGVLRELLPYGLQFANLLLSWTQRLGDAANTTQFSDAIAKFFAYVRENGPAVGDFLKLLIANIVGLGRSAAPLGPVILDIVNTLLKLTAAVLNSPAGPYVLGLTSIGLAAKSAVGPIEDMTDTAKNISTFGRAVGGSEAAMKKLGTAGTISAKGIRAVGGGAKAIIGAVVSLAGSLYAGAAAAWAFIAPFLPWIAAAAAVAAAAYLLYRNWDTVWNAMKKVFDVVVGFISDHWKLLLALIPGIGPVIALVASNWSTIWNAIKAVFQAVVGAIVTAAQFMWGVLTSLFTTSLGIISAIWNTVWNAIKTVALFIWSLISAGITREINAILAIIRFVTAVAQAVWNAGLNAMRAVAAAVWGAITGIVSGAINAVMGAVNRVFAIAGIFASALGAAVGAVGSGIGRIVGIFGGLWGAITGAIGDVVGNIYRIGLNIVDGLVRGVQDAWHRITDTISGLASHLPGPVKKVLGIGSPSKVFAEIGTNIVQGLEVGVNAQTASLIGTLRDLSSTTANMSPSQFIPAAPAVSGSGGGVSISFDFSGSTFGADSPEVLKSAVTSTDVLDKINKAARAGVRPG